MLNSFLHIKKKIFLKLLFKFSNDSVNIPCNPQTSVVHCSHNSVLKKQLYIYIAFIIFFNSCDTILNHSQGRLKNLKCPCIAQLCVAVRGCLEDLKMHSLSLKIKGDLLQSPAKRDSMH